MGVYINPRDMSKEEWLAKNACQILSRAPETHREGDKIVVCLIDNGRFTAAGVAFDERELKDFAREDGRPKIWLRVPLAKLHELNLANYVK